MAASVCTGSLRQLGLRGMQLGNGLFELDTTTICAASWQQFNHTPVFSCNSPAFPASIFDDDLMQCRLRSSIISVSGMLIWSAGTLLHGPLAACLRTSWSHLRQQVVLLPCQARSRTVPHAWTTMSPPVDLHEARLWCLPQVFPGCPRGIERLPVSLSLPLNL